mmetsp:Transcript_4480/g.6267  ORF Transcript_4480/g.6267 Transcript_4480/m.6267 type:complete len:216 (+) Transcript_4480:268-915(+)
MDMIHRPLAHEEGKIVYTQAPDNTYTQCIVLSAPINDENELYTIQESVSGDIHELMADTLLDANPDVIPTDPIPSSVDNPFPLLPWIKVNVKVTLYLDKITDKPKQGILHHSPATDSWSFSPGKADKHPHLQLPNLSALAQSMVTNKNIFQGWKLNQNCPNRTMYQSNIQYHCSTCQRIYTQRSQCSISALIFLMVYNYMKLNLAMARFSHTVLT